MLGIGATVNLIISKHTTLADIKKLWKEKDDKEDTIDAKNFQSLLATLTDVVITFWAWLVSYIIFNFFMKV
jgi:hypothetical protein